MMFLTRRDPSLSLPTFHSLQREMNRLFDEAFGGMPDSGTRTWSPPTEIYETADELVILIELPGFFQKDISIAFDNGQVSISGERIAPSEEGKNYHRNERWYGRFERSFQLTPTFDAERISAQLKDGILVVKLPKKPESKPRQIPVKIG